MFVFLALFSGCARHGGTCRLANESLSSTLSPENTEMVNYFREMWEINQINVIEADPCEIIGWKPSLGRQLAHKIKTRASIKFTVIWSTSKFL